MTINSRCDNEVFYDADEGISNSVPPDADEKQDIAPPQTQHNLFDQRRRCSHCCGIPQRFPRTHALMIRVFLPLYSLIAIAMFFGYFLCRLEAPKEIHDNNMSLAANQMMDHLARMNELAGRVIPLLCLDDYLMHLNGTLFVKDFKAYNNQQYLEKLSSDFKTLNISISNFTEMRNFISTCGLNGSEGFLEFQRTAIDDTILDEYLGSEVTFNWIKCPLDKTDAGPNEKDLTDVVSETFALYEAGEQLKHVQERWEQDFNKTFDRIYMEHLNMNKTAVEARQKALAEAYVNANGFDGCVEDVMSAAWWSL